MIPWFWIALGMNCIAVLVLAGACWVSIRGLGGISALRSQLIVLETALEACSERITREVKARAGQIGADKAKDDRNILQQAQDELTLPNNVAAITERPKRTFRRR